MDAFLLDRFRSEVALQCKFIGLSAGQLQARHNEMNAAQEGIQAARAKLALDPDDQTARREKREHIARLMDKDSATMVWLVLQNILVSAANISKLLWGSRGAKDAARADLRSSLGVDDTSYLRATKLRNDFEHFDERLESWFRENPNLIFVGRNMGQAGRVQDASGKAVLAFGHYDPVTAEVSFWANSASIARIVDEAARILQLADTGTDPV